MSSQINISTFISWHNIFLMRSGGALHMGEAVQSKRRPRRGEYMVVGVLSCVWLRTFSSLLSTLQC